MAGEGDELGLRAMHRGRGFTSLAVDDIIDPAGGPWAGYGHAGGIRCAGCKVSFVLGLLPAENAGFCGGLARAVGPAGVWPG